MPLVSARELMLKAQKGRYALGAFNVENMEMAQAVVAAAEELAAPVIIQVTAGTLKYAEPEMYRAMVAELAGAAKVSVAIHLDHGNSYELAMRCKRAGFTSLMIDGSTKPFEENIAISKRVVSDAGDLPVEAELGTVGGKEDDHEAEGSGYTDPDQAVEFVKRTGVATLAVAIGTAHGVYKGVPKLDIERLKAIRKVVSVPLVLHGASGVPDDQVRRCIEEGICKVNYATELRIAYTRGVKAAIAENPEAFDPKVYGKAGRAEVMRVVKERIGVLGSGGKS